MRRKGADNKEMMLVGSGTRCPISACMLHTGIDLKTPATGILILSFYIAASRFGLQQRSLYSSRDGFICINEVHNHQVQPGTKTTAPREHG